MLPSRCINKPTQQCYISNKFDETRGIDVPSRGVWHFNGQFPNKKPRPAARLFKSVSQKFWRVVNTLSQGLAAADDAQQDDHNGDHQQNMDETADGIRTDQSDQPQDYEYDCDGVKHGNFLSGYD